MFHLRLVPDLQKAHLRMLENKRFFFFFFLRLKHAVVWCASRLFATDEAKMGLSAYRWLNLTYQVQRKKSCSFSNAVATSMCFLPFAGVMRIPWCIVNPELLTDKGGAAGTTVGTPEEGRLAFHSPDSPNTHRWQSQSHSFVTRSQQ